jgi:long-chain fatty acid transport protein
MQSPRASLRVLAGLAATASLLVFASDARAQAGAIIVYENGSPDIGSAYAGAGARASDAATAFQNPAGMTRLEGNNLLLGTMGILSDMEFDIDVGGSTGDPAGAIGGGGDIGTFAPGLGSFGVFEINETMRFGFSINVLAANGVDYDHDWAGRTFVTKNQFIAANIGPGLAWKMNDQWSFGASLNAVYLRLDQELKADSTAASPTVKIDEADDWGFGGTFGLLYEPDDDTRWGLVYRTEVETSLSGDIDSPMPNVNFDGDFTLPQGINLSVYRKLNPKLALLADAGWSDWSEFGEVPTTIGAVSIDVDRGWDDTWRLGVGFEYELNEEWLLRGGVSYDSSPVEDDRMLPDIPAGEQYRFSVGVQRDVGDGKVFSLGYTLMYTDIEIDQVALPPGGSVVLDGDYDPSFVHFFGFSLALSF